MDYSGYQLARVEVVDGVASVVINNPPINIFDLPLYGEMAKLAGELATDNDVRVVILSSANPDFFIPHFDVGLILQIPQNLPTPTELNTFTKMCEAFREMPKATIAVIEGRIGGGGSELALSCDMRFALRGKAIFNQPEVALGIIPGGSGTVRLSRLVGRSRALEVVLGCDDIDADTAEQWGWVNRAFNADELWPFVNRMAQRIASFPPAAVQEAKAAILRSDHNIHDELLQEAIGFNKLLADPRAQTAMQNFMERGGQTSEGEKRLGELAGEIN